MSSEETKDNFLLTYLFFINLIINLNKTFMKKLFTLLGVVLMASSAFGQKWQNLVVNGDCEGTAPAYTNYSQCTDVNAWNSFWVHEWPGDMSTQYEGTANIVEDPADATNHCVKVVVRSDAEAKDAGTRVEANGNLASWDCQFFIYATEPMPVGNEVRLTMWVKADKAGSIETQAHYGPGNYNHYQLFGNINVTTEWKEITTDVVIVSDDHAGTNDGKQFQSVAFNLSTTTAGNVIYFDNIKLQSKAPKQDDPDTPVEWINFMRRGIYSSDHITGVDGNGNPWECSNFTVQDLNKPAGEQQQKAPVVEVPGEPGVFAVQVPVKSYYIKQVEDLDEAGEQQFDPETGEIKMKNIYYWNDGIEIGTSAPARWQCQFFVSTLHKMKGGEKYKFRFQAKADKPSALGTQAHYGPGQYKDYNTFGSESDFPIGLDWTTFDLGEAQGKTVPSGANGCQTITFDCVPLEGEEGNCEPNNFYFIFEECSFTEANVTDGDRTLGTAEYLVIPVDGEDGVYKLDATAMLNTYEAEDFSFLKEGDGIKLLSQKEDPEEDGHMIDTYSSMLTLKDGGFIGADGYFLGLDSDKGIQLNFNEESIDGNNINLEIWNNPEANITIGDGNMVSTKLVISQSGWYYLYNITLMSSADYELYLNGVKDVEDKIEAIDEVVTLDSKAGIDVARGAYDALPVYAQKNVSNYAKLTAAEAEYKRLADIKDCIDKIDAIGEVVLTEDCKALIDAARSAYDALSDASKEAITNYQTLVDAEKKYADLESAGISTVTFDSAKSGIMYDLMGRQVTKASKGLYILNGKKYFQK